MNTQADSKGQRAIDIVTVARGSGSTEDQERISLGDPHQVQEYARKLGVTAERLRELVAQVGPRVCDLQQRLSQPAIAD